VLPAGSPSLSPTRTRRRRAASGPAGGGNGDLHEGLRDLETDVTALYEEWAQYLRSMQAPTPTVESSCRARPWTAISCAWPSAPASC
jgi:hypothetical protein